MAQIIQLMHAKGFSNGNQYRWSTMYEPTPDLLDRFESLSNREIEIQNL